MKNTLKRRIKVQSNLVLYNIECVNPKNCGSNGKC